MPKSAVRSDAQPNLDSEAQISAAPGTGGTTRQIKSAARPAATTRFLRFYDA
jgi:hypothetical protein